MALDVNNLIGFGAGGAPLTLTFVNSAISSSTTINVPATAAAGDLAWLFDMRAGDTTFVTPAGWTSLATATDGSIYVGQVSRKTLLGGDVGAAITGQPGTTSKIMLVFRPSLAVATATSSTWQAAVTNDNPPPQVVLAAGQPVPLIVFGCAVVGNDANPAAFTVASPAFDATVLGDRMIAGYKIYNSGPADHTIDSGDLGGGNMLFSGYTRFS